MSYELRIMKGIELRLDMLVVLVIIVVIGVMMASCNVTRTVTTKSEYMQRGDTSVIIQTKTVESYDGRRN